MKKILYSILLLSILFFIGCEDKKEESESLPYKDLSVIYLGKEKFNCLDNYCHCNNYPGVLRQWYCYYGGTEPTDSDFSWWREDVDWVNRSFNKVKYLHYYVSDNYIEYEEVGEDQLESFDLEDYVIIEYEEN